MTAFAKSAVWSSDKGHPLRWFLVGWIMQATVLNYMDRQTLSIVAPLLRDELKLSNEEYSHIVSAFLASYTVMYTVSGRFVDWVGEKVGMAASIVWWSIATMLHGIATGPMSLGVYRFCLGIGEPGNMPAALKTITLWFGKAERGVPVAMYASGTAIGGIIAPPIIAGLTLRYGWRSAFVVPGALGLFWVIVWLRFYRRPRMGAPVISAGTGIRWLELLKDRNVLALMLARLISDPVWYFYLFWTPEYLKRARAFTLADIGLYAWIPFAAAFAGGMLGGLASDRLIAGGSSAPRARRIVLYGAAALAPLAALTGAVSSSAASVALIALAAFVCYVWFANTAALVADVFPESVVGSVQGLIGTAGSGGGILFNLLIGVLLDRFSYSMVFSAAALLHVSAAVVLFAAMSDREEARAALTSRSA